MSRQANIAPFAKKSLGQNFLVDQSYISRILSAVTTKQGDSIIEIGPGRGAITEYLVEAGAEVVAIELDRELIGLLRNQFSDASNFRIVEADALEVDFRSLIESFSVTGPVKLVANLPYYISTAILQRLADHRDMFSQLILMFQSEVVNRIVAPAGSSERGFLTVVVEECFSVEKLFDVPPSAFRPQPKIWSSVVRLLPNETTRNDLDSLRRLASMAFSQKRKTISNNLKEHFPDAKAKLVAAGIDPGRRAETLSNTEWHRLLGAFS